MWNNQLYLLVLFIFPNKHEVWNKQGSLNLNNLSSAQQKHSKLQTRDCYLLKLYAVCYLANQ